MQYRARERRTARSRIAGLIVLVALTGLPIAMDALAQDPGIEGRLELRPSPPAAPPTVPDGKIGLILDDGGQEAAFGVTSGGGAAQFLWFNRFEVEPAVPFFRLEEIWVLFPDAPGLEPGDAIQLLIYHDADDDPANGARLLAAAEEVIQVANDATFSIYPVDPPLAVPGDGTVILGVVNRWVRTGLGPPVSPASLDLDRPRGRSWFATWIGDPPDPPLLPPDGTLVRIDDFDPDAAGNWMIRGFGSGPNVIEIPTLEPRGACLLALILLVSGLLRLAARSRGDPLADSPKDL